MGNSLGCSASGERLVSAARDGDLVEARMLLEFNPALAKYSTFRGLNSPLHFAAAKGHSEIVMLLLEKGADVNLKNYCGQTALMQACRHGHWEVVQNMLIFRSIVTRADYLSGRTALHFAAAGGHARCIRLLVADFVPSAPYEIITTVKDGGGRGSSSRGSTLDSSSDNKHDQLAMLKFINKPADGGITALHMAALSGHFDCVQLLLDLGANVSAVTFHYGTSDNLIGAGSTPLHFAVYGGNLRCCQLLLARGASRLILNCNGWLPIDVAKIWGRRCLEPLLNPNSELTIPVFALSNYLSLPLMSILNIARESGLQSSSVCDEHNLCAVCLERACSVAAEGCAHELCVKCALHLCSASNTPSEIVGPPGSIPCPLCRNGVVSFIKLPSTPAKGMIKPNLALSLCSPCILHPRAVDIPVTSCGSEVRRNRVASVSAELICPITCTSFPAGVITSCTCDDDPCTSNESQGEVRSQSSRGSHATSDEPEKMEERRVDTSCLGMFWSRRSCHREFECNSEINALCKVDFG